jgi:hypothetical protein
MNNPPPAVRILPMDSKETPGFVGQSIEEIQQQFFLHELARPQKPAGKFCYRKSGLRAESGTVVLFQFAGKIIASAVLTSVERFETTEMGGHEGAYHFDVNSIKVFDPIGPTVVSKIWPQVTRLGQAKWSLDPKRYATFERKLTGVETPEF